MGLGLEALPATLQPRSPGPTSNGRAAEARLPGRATTGLGHRMPLGLQLHVGLAEEGAAREDGVEDPVPHRRAGSLCGEAAPWR